MKIVLTTTTLIALLAISLLGIGNSSSNIENVFAQTDPENPPVMEEDKNISIMTMSTNQSEPGMMNWTGTIDGTCYYGQKTFKSQVTTDIIGGNTNQPQTNVGANSTVKEAELTNAHGFLVYKITASR